MDQPPPSLPPIVYLLILPGIAIVISVISVILAGCLGRKANKTADKSFDVARKSFTYNVKLDIERRISEDESCLKGIEIILKTLSDQFGLNLSKKEKDIITTLFDGIYGLEKCKKIVSTLEEGLIKVYPAGNVKLKLWHAIHPFIHAASLNVDIETSGFIKMCEQVQGDLDKLSERLLEDLKMLEAIYDRLKKEVEAS